MVAETRGSSSSSAVVLELLHRGLAPAAIVLGAVDAIVGLGLLVGAEMGLGTCPLLILAAADQNTVPRDAVLTIDPDGRVWVEPAGSVRGIQSR